MRVVYTAENLIDAHLVKGLLESEGLMAFVLGEHLTGGAGDLPVMGLVSVGVAEVDLEAAERVLQEWRGGDDPLPAATPGWGLPDPA